MDILWNTDNLAVLNLDLLDFSSQTNGFTQGGGTKTRLSANHRSRRNLPLPPESFAQGGGGQLGITRHDLSTNNSQEFARGPNE